MENRLEALKYLGEKLSLFLKEDCLNHLPDEDFYNKGKEIITQAKHYNKWFLEDQIIFALQSWARALISENLEKWLNQNQINEPNNPKKIGLILAGNIPLVGLHDVISTFISGHISMIKLSSQDKFLLPWLIDSLIASQSTLEKHFQFVERLVDYDSVIATGSDNSAHYFDYYFSKVPNIIRKNRNSIAVLTGNENREELEKLGHDIFQYFGLGCRNVSKIFVPENYDFSKFFEAIKPFENIMNYEKYASNYDYNKAVFLMSNLKFLDNGFLTLKADEKFSSPISTLFYEEYSSLTDVFNIIENNIDKLQCVVGQPLKDYFIPFGDTQSPQLWDYADGINTLDFLSRLD